MIADYAREKWLLFVLSVHALDNAASQLVVDRSSLLLEMIRRVGNLEGRLIRHYFLECGFVIPGMTFPGSPSLRFSI